jgi:dihydrodipicolinate synthase/N-acetylneuraminate lyase
VVKEIKGIVLPLMTPFQEDGELDERLGCELADFVIGAGVHALFLLGSFGQGPVLQPEQRKKFAEVIVKHVRGRVPVIVHIGTADVYSTVDLALHARSIGCDAIAAVGPYYYSDHSEYEIFEHFRELGQRTEMPLLIYNNPPYQGYDITPAMMLRLKEQIPQLFGTKLSADSLETALAYLDQLPKDFSIFGLASALMPGALYGIRGTIIPPMNAFPELSVALWKALEERRLEDALKLQKQINDLRGNMRKLVRNYGLATHCEAVRLRGFPVKKFPRWTTKPLSEADRETLRNVFKENGIPTY